MHPYVSIFGYPVGTYGLWMLAGLLAGFALLKRLFRARGIRWECALFVLSCAFALALLGALILLDVFPGL